MPSVKIDRYLRVAIGLLLVALVYVIYASIHERVVVAGDAAPGFTIATDSGRSVSVPDFGGKLLVLNFWASWCPASPKPRRSTSSRGNSPVRAWWCWASAWIGTRRSIAPSCGS